MQNKYTFNKTMTGKLIVYQIEKTLENTYLLSSSSVKTMLIVFEKWCGDLKLNTAVKVLFTDPPEQIKYLIS